MNLGLGIIGYGFVGNAVAHAFNNNVDKFIVDPKYWGRTIDDLMEVLDPHAIFVCVPTPTSLSGEADTAIIMGVFKHLHDIDYDGIVVVKSTVPANVMMLVNDIYNLRIVYNPEFLSEKTAFEDFINPPMQILGGELEDCNTVEYMYKNNSKVKIVTTYKTDIATACLTKYAINSFLSTKLIFMNEMKEVLSKSEAASTWEQFADILACDPRIGKTHMEVPGHDGKRGFGGNCLPKDTKALAFYAKSIDAPLTVLEAAIKKNEEIR